MTHKRATKYTLEELDNAAIADIVSDIRQSEEQAENGPFHTEKGITRESLLEYARECKAKLEKYKNGGLHNAILKGL